MKTLVATRKKAVGKLLKAIRKIREQPVYDSIFEQGSHTKSSQPFFAETGYKVWLHLRKLLIVDHINSSGGFRGGSKGSMEPPFWIQ